MNIIHWLYEYNLLAVSIQHNMSQNMLQKLSKICQIIKIPEMFYLFNVSCKKLYAMGQRKYLDLPQL